MTCSSGSASGVCRTAPNGWRPARWRARREPSVPVSSDRFAGHRIEAEAGRGGMGVVYRARHLRLDRVGALKLLPVSARSEREWRLLAALDHPHVIPVYEAGVQDGQAYLSMRWVNGGDLAARL